ncbi:hypothetical protein SYNPS1DRAFT_4320, partial [Syncephalis pseudoplumigaleata]
RPILALTVTNGVLAGVSDDATDSAKTSPAVPEDAPHDLGRTVRFATYGFAIAPVIHHWYALLDRRFPLPAASGAAGARLSTQIVGQAVKRVLGDQLVFAPVGLAVFFSAMTLFEGGGPAQIREKLRTSYVSALTASYMVWPAVQFVNFCFVPLMLRVPFVSAVSVVWNCYLSHLN